MDFPRRVDGYRRATRGVREFLSDSTYARRHLEPGVADLAFGNPHELALDEYVAALRRHVEPRNKDWFAYKLSEPQARSTVAATLREIRQLAYQPEDVMMTNGGFAALTVALNALVEVDDEVIFVSPPWFFYEAMIHAVGAVPVRVRVDPVTFDLDVQAIADAITARTRMIIVNSPNNPTGRIYPEETLRELATVLREASNRHGRRIIMLSDEAYSRIVFDGAEFPSPTAFYTETLIAYTYGKTLLTPGQRIGYLAVHPEMEAREEIREVLETAQFMIGWGFPNALLQHALPEIEPLTLDVGKLERRRDRLVSELRSTGYDVHVPEGTFYLLPRSPIEDDESFVERLAAHDVFCLPGAIVEMPGYFRMSLTANDEMVERAIEALAAVRVEMNGPVASQAASGGRGSHRSK